MTAKPGRIARERAGAAAALRSAVVAGAAGGAAMIPVGVGLELGGHGVNVYGELVVKTVLGGAPGWALLLEHVLVSLTLAVPLVLALDRRGRVPAPAVGILYGAGAWLVINSLLLPALFSRSIPWTVGWEAVWPSLTVHLVYGGVGAAALTVVGASSRRAKATRRREAVVGSARP